MIAIFSSEETIVLPLIIILYEFTFNRGQFNKKILQNKIIEKITIILELKEQISNGLRFWNVEVYDSKEQQNLKNVLDNFKDFLD